MDLKFDIYTINRLVVRADREVGRPLRKPLDEVILDIKGQEKIFY